MSAVPEKWKTTTVGELCNLINGKAFKPSDWTEEGLPIVRIQNLNKPTAPYNHFDGEVAEQFKIDKGQLLFAWSGTPGTSFGAHVWNGGPAVLNQHIFKVEIDETNLDKAFFRNAINQTLNELIHKAHGGVGLRHVTKGVFESTEIPLPPLAEQRRIVETLDRLSARTRAAKDHLAKVQSLATRAKQATLAAAFRGELTEDAASPRPKTKTATIKDPFTHTQEAPETWSNFMFSDICKIIGGSQPAKSNFVYAPQKDFIRLIQIRDYKSDKKATYIPRDLARRFCSETDIMIGRYGPPIFQILRGIEGAYNVALMKAQPTELVDQAFLFWYLHHPILFRYVEIDSKRTAGQDGVNKAHLQKWPILLPPLKEQAEIVRRIETAFARIDKMVEEASRAAELLERLEQELLAKAFRGELVAQDPNDEPASVLLERIREARASAQNKKRSR